MLGLQLHKNPLNKQLNSDVSGFNVSQLLMECAKSCDQEGVYTLVRRLLAVSQQRNVAHLVSPLQSDKYLYFAVLTAGTADRENEADRRRIMTRIQGQVVGVSIKICFASREQIPIL